MLDKQYKDLMKELKSQINHENREGMTRFGIKTDKALGIPLSILRPTAKRIGTNHNLSLKLWESEIHEARLLAAIIGDPERVTENQMESWVKQFDSWDICDQVCFNLFDRTPFAYGKALEWSKREEEFVKRAGFALMASLAVHDKKTDDKKFERFFPAIKRGSKDERNFVKKAVNWALRQIGKRNLSLNKKAIRLAKEIKKIDTKSARWIASDALRELESEKILERLKKKKKK